MFVFLSSKCGDNHTLNRTFIFLVMDIETTEKKLRRSKKTIKLGVVTLALKPKLRYLQKGSYILAK